MTTTILSSPTPTSAARDARGPLATPLRSRTAVALTSGALVAAARLRTAVWDHRARDPRPAQTAMLRALCDEARRTAFGRAHALDQVRSYADFRRRVPLRTVAEFEPWLTRMRAGEPDVLWPGFVGHFARSAGSSSHAGGYKYLPASRRQIRWQTRAAFDVIARYLVLSGDTALTAGYTLGIVARVAIAREGAVGVATNPALLLHHAPRAGRRFTLPQPPIDAIADNDARLDAIVATYMDHDVRVLAGTVGWFSVLFDRLVAAARARGRTVTSVRDVWPNLRGLITGGANPEPYKPMLRARLGAMPAMLDHYNCSEAGLIACTDRLEEPDMLFVPDRGVFYEFIPRGEYGAPGARRLPLWEVVAGEEYAVVMSTPSGLLGYVVGDYVRFTSTAPHRLVLSGRIGGALSPAHESTTEGALEAAVRAASDACGATVVDFAAAAEVGVGGRPQSRYRVYVEFERAPADVAGFERALDEALGRFNSMYAVRRSGDALLLAPVLCTLPRGAARRFMHALGRDSVQAKFPHTLSAAQQRVLEQVATRGDAGD